MTFPDLSIVEPTQCGAHNPNDSPAAGSGAQSTNSGRSLQVSHMFSPASRVATERVLSPGRLDLPRELRPMGHLNATLPRD